MRDAFKWQRHQVGELNSRVEDSLLGIRVVKSFANEDVEIKKFEDGNLEFLEAKKMGYKYMADLVGTYVDYIIRENPDDFKQVGFIGKDVYNVNEKW